MSVRLPACVIDVGTGYTKLGFAGDIEPKLIIPTVLAMDNFTSIDEQSSDHEDLELSIGEEAFVYPMCHGFVDDWNLMEKFLAQCISQHLKVNPENHHFLLTEPLLNTPASRQHMAEIMFETFSVPGLNIGVQPLLALVSAWTTKRAALTGIVIESGESETYVVPITQGHVIGSCIEQIPMAGSDITSFIESSLRERKVAMPHEQSFEIAKAIKEKFCYTCPDMAKEFEKYKSNKWIRHYDQQFSVDLHLGYERFMAPEILFQPKLSNYDFTTPLSEVVDNVIQKCPIDLRRSMYQNIVLSGGSTLFKNFGRRLQRDVQRIVDARLQMNEHLSEGRIKPKPIEVQVISHRKQRFAVWFGGSMFASMDNFHEYIYTKAAYDECGSSMCRHNPVFGV